MLLDLMPQLSSLHFVFIPPGLAERNRGSRCGNPHVAHSSRVIAKIDAAMLGYKPQRASSAVVLAGCGYYQVLDSPDGLVYSAVSPAEISWDGSYRGVIEK
ncbi:hypothetical protein C8J57DRAFT_114043 [Mycena rebaudengoi]|nr:hypothetical protein C8J57DRAFT_114043 [Mycena rebaudengoi]